MLFFYVPLHRLSAGEGALLNPESNATMKKSKIVKWEYVTNPFDVLVIPETVKRVHAPLAPSLSHDQLPLPKGGGGVSFLHLRPCVQGEDECGCVIKYLYCTRYGRFFVRGKDGWSEVLPTGYGNNPKAKGGSSDCPQMCHFGWKPCHRCVAFAWLDVPEDVKLQMIGVDAPRKWEVDHINTDHKNWAADNLEWVTPVENMRRGRIAKRFRKAGIDPKLIYTNMLKGIYRLPEESIGMLTGLFLFLSHEEFGDETLDKRTLNACLYAALNETYEKLS